MFVSAHNNLFKLVFLNIFMAKQQKDNKFDFNKIEKKWQKKWATEKIFEVDLDKKKPKMYVLEMYPYPSASFLHMGHVRNYTIGDSFARFKRMKGFNVLYPMGYDSFGLPAEMAAKKEGIHPRKYTEKAIEKISEYFKALGNSYDWSKTLASHEPEYYRWNQFFFLKFLEKDLVYSKEAPVNWCENCQSVLANEEAESGKCWRCGNEVIKKNMKQWFFRITKYADRLLDDMDKIEWSDRIKTLQRNWIGKSYGTEIQFEINKEVWPIFTTRPDTIHGVTFMVISAQHPRLLEITADKYKKDMIAFVDLCNKARTPEEIEKLEKIGEFTGSYAINPVTKDKIPVYAGNFVVADYGCGMVMAVPAHDQRDFEFAKKYKIPIKVVIQPKDSKLDANKMIKAYTEEGVLVNSGEFNDIKSSDAIEKITDFLAKKKLGKKTVNYKIRDWLISRQRYWGTPIPIIHCKKCGIVPVPEKELPVLLPEKVDFKTSGNPIATNKTFVNTTCPKCGEKATRETDTMGGFMDSSWYFLRYCDNKNKTKPFDKAKVDYWMPVDQYIGGIEHAVGHLIYARFFTKVLKEMGYVSIDEPFKKLFNQGIVNKGGIKMSKSKGNVVFQTDISNKYGIDTARLFLMFVSSPDKPMEWSDEGVEGSFRIINRLIRLSEVIDNKPNPKLDSKVHSAIKKVTESIETFEYPKAIVSIIEAIDAAQEGISKENYEILLKLISPFCPHVAEEMWSRLGNKSFISIEKWPVADEKKINEKFEQQEKAVEKLSEDINNIARIIKEKGKPAAKCFLYVIPPELKQHQDSIELLQKKTSLEIKVFAVNDKAKYDPENKAGKAKPGRPAIYLE